MNKDEKTRKFLEVLTKGTPTRNSFATRQERKRYPMLEAENVTITRHVIGGLNRETPCNVYIPVNTSFIQE